MSETKTWIQIKNATESDYRWGGVSHTHFHVIVLRTVLPAALIFPPVSLALLSASRRMSQCNYLSPNDPRLHFGLGAITVVDVQVRWPDVSPKATPA